MNKKQSVSFLSLCIIVTLSVILISCTRTIVKEKEYNSQQQIAYSGTSVNNEVVSELRRVFQKTYIEGNGIFENDNEGLARRTAINLAVAELASQVQSLVRADSVVYNNKDVRDVVETRINALVNNYRIDSAGYDSGTKKYRVRVSISGEDLVREVQKQIK
jgi:hypothetical protein